MFEFQLCAKSDHFPEPEGWVIEQKFNGVRLAIEYTKDGVVGWGRGGAEFGIPSHILGALPDCLGVGVIIDGEFCFGEDEHSAMGVLSRRRVPPVGSYKVFDLLWPGKRETLSQRKLRITSLFSSFNQLPVHSVEALEAEEYPPREFLESVLAGGGEGIVMKRRAAIYSPGRKITWLKFKDVPS